MRRDSGRSPQREVIMDTKPQVLVIFATWHGKARAIAEHIAAVLLANGVDAEPCDARTIWRDGIDASYDGVIVVSSVHFGTHSRLMQRVVRSTAPQLAKLQTAFVSISGAAASLDGLDESERYIRRFLQATKWGPDFSYSCAGSIPFTQYGPLLRLMMKFTARVAGRGTDTTRDYDYTNWTALDALVHLYLERLHERLQKRSIA